MTKPQAKTLKRIREYVAKQEEIDFSIDKVDMIFLLGMIDYHIMMAKNQPISLVNKTG